LDPSVASVSLVKSAERAIDIIELMARSGRPLRAMTIARRCRIPRSSAYHLLATLRRRRYLHYDAEARLWSLGRRLAELAGSDPTLAEVIAVLDAFDARHPRLGPTQLVRASGLVLTTVERALEILVEDGLVTAHRDGSYSLGVQVAALAARLPDIQRLRAAARPRLVELRDRSGETANLLVRGRDDAVYLDQVESLYPLRHAGWAGRRIPLGTSAGGQALVDRSRVHVVSDAVEAGVTAVALGLDVSRVEAAAISITGPTARLHGPVIDIAKGAVAETAEKIARDLAPVRRRASGRRDAAPELASA
jgi:urocanate hydratase